LRNPAGRCGRQYVGHPSPDWPQRFDKTKRLDYRKRMRHAQRPVIRLIGQTRRGNALPGRRPVHEADTWPQNGQNSRRSRVRPVSLLFLANLETATAGPRLCNRPVLQVVTSALLTCVGCWMSRALMVVSVGLFARRRGVGALRGGGVSADARAYFGPRLGVATGRVRDVMGVSAGEGAAAQSCEAFPLGGVGSRAWGTGRGSSVIVGLAG
jgi:hypothetical protein